MLAETNTSVNLFGLFIAKISKLSTHVINTEMHDCTVELNSLLYCQLLGTEHQTLTI